MRGIAALWVVGHHLALRFVNTGDAQADRFLMPGFIAVDIFFILSGFVLAIAYRDLALRAAPAFLLRRAFRIYPLHLAVMAALVVYAGARLVLGRPETPGLPWDRLADALTLTQVYDDVPLSWNIASWSLGIEMGCYLLFPVALLVLRWLPRVALALAAAALACVEYLVLDRWQGSTFGLGAMLRGVAGFVLGMALHLAVRERALSPRLCAAGELAALAGLGAALLAGQLALVPLCAALGIVFLFFDAGPLALLLRRSWPVGLGRISYSFYLIHLPLISVLAMAVPPALVPLPAPWNLVAWSAMAVVLSLLLSAFTFRFIEEPARRYGALLAQSFGRKRAAAPAGLVITL